MASRGSDSTGGTSGPGRDGVGEPGSLDEALRSLHMLQDELARAHEEITDVHGKLEASRRFAADQAERRLVAMERAERELEDRRIVAESLVAERDELRRRVADLEEELESRRNELQAIRASRSFRFSEGLRGAYDGTRAFLGR